MLNISYSLARCLNYRLRRKDDALGVASRVRATLGVNAVNT